MIMRVSLNIARNGLLILLMATMLALAVFALLFATGVVG
jgi:hypothetical protein